MNLPLVTIVMLCWNRIEDVRESLSRLRESTYQHLQVIAVDNGSTDGTHQMIENEFPEVQLLKMYKNLGIEAYNIGFENAKGKYIVILDDDSFPGKNAIERMVQRFEQDPRLGVVAFDVRNYYNYDDINNIEPDVDNNTRAVDTQSYYMSFNGAGVGIRTELFKQIGYYPEEFFLYNNELDSAFRIWDSGYSIQYFPDIVGYHKYSPKNRSSWRAPYYYTRNAFWVVWKNYPSKFAMKLTLELMYNCFFYSFEQRTWVYLKAMFSAFAGIGNLKGKRKPVDPDIANNLRFPININFTFFR